MPTTLKEISKENIAAKIVVESSAESDEPKRDAAWYIDQDPTLYPEAAARVLTPRRRTVVTTETLAAIRAICDKH